MDVGVGRPAAGERAVRLKGHAGAPPAVGDYWQNSRSFSGLMWPSALPVKRLRVDAAIPAAVAEVDVGVGRQHRAPEAEAVGGDAVASTKL